MQVVDVTKRGIYRPATKTIAGLDPIVSQVTVQLVKAVATTTQRIWFPDLINVKGAIILRNGTEAGIDGGGGSVNNNKSIGFTDGTSMVCIHNMIDPEDEADGADVNHSHSDITLSRRMQAQPWTAAVEEAYDIVGVGVGYIDIATTVDTSLGQDKWVTVIAFGGPDVTSVDIFDVDDLGAGTDPVSVTGLTLNENKSLVFIATVNESETLASFDDTNKSAAADCKISYGYAINSTGTPQGCLSVGSLHNTNPMDTTQLVSNTKCLSVVSGGSGVYNVTAGGFTASSFTLTPSASASNAICVGMVVTFSDDVNLTSVDVSLPSAGNYAQADIGFKPLCGILFAQSGPSSYDAATQASFSCENITVITERESMTHAFSAIHGADSYALAGNSGLATAMEMWHPDTEVSGNPCFLIFDTSAYSLDSEGWDYTVATNHSSAILGFAIAIG